VKLCNSRHRRDTLAPQLSQLLSFRRVNINETIHIANAEALDVVLRRLLPLGS
jgi:hypothetical protein